MMLTMTVQDAHIHAGIRHAWPKTCNANFRFVSRIDFFKHIVDTGIKEINGV